MSEPRVRPKILVVDDSELCLEVVRMQLEARGFYVTCMDSPIGFGAALQRERPDLALVDACMPALDGAKLIAIVRQHGPACCPILLHSDRPEAELQRLVEASGADGYIVKTSDGARLERTIREKLLVLSRVRSREPAGVPDAFKSRGTG